MVGIANKPSTAMFSHNGGWTHALMSITKSKFGTNVNVNIVSIGFAIHAYDAVIINEGLNYKKGKWNFFGGMDDKSKEMIEQLRNYKGEVFSYNEEICWESLLKRKEIRDEGYKVSDFPIVSRIYTHKNGPRIIIGDSHSLSIYKPGYGISRNDGATLFGSLKDTGLLHTRDLLNYSYVTLYFGNIDVRFHLMRQKNPQYALRQLCGRYNEFIVGLVEKGVKVTVQGLLPIESESRKIPGTGLYKGEPFFGSKRERQALVYAFNYTMSEYADSYKYKFRSWDLPIDGFDEMEKFYCMESRQSVHLRPDYYLFKDEILKHGED